MEDLLIKQITAEELRQLITETYQELNIMADVPDFDVSISQAERILGVTFPTIKSYMEEGYLVNVSTDGRRAKFSFYNVLEIRKKDIRYKRFRNLNH